MTSATESDPVIEVGPREVIATKDQRRAAGLDYWPDGTMGVIPGNDSNGERQYRFIAANSRVIGTAWGSLSNPISGAVVPEQSILNQKQEYQYAAGGPIYRDPANAQWLLFYHAEIHREGNFKDFESVLGMARSTDEGATWHDLGEIIKPCIPPGREDDTIIEVGGAQYVIVGDYFHVYLLDFEGDRGRQLAVARARISDVADAALNGRTAPWFKFHERSWDEPALGGRASSLDDDPGGNAWFDVSFNEYIGKYVMVSASYRMTEAQAAAGPPYRSYIEYRESDDGLVWSDRHVVEDAVADHFYPTIVGLGAEPRMSGSVFHVYYTSSDIGGWDRWDDSDLIRRTVRVPAARQREGAHLVD